MTRNAWLYVAVLISILASALVCAVAWSEPATSDHAPLFVKEIPAGYRDWPVISVAREEGKLDDIRAVLGNSTVMAAYRDGKLPFPEGSIVARLAWSYDASDENNRTFGRAQSFVAGHPKNGVQFMVKDSKKYAATGGWGYAHFENGKPVSDTVLSSCFPCHAAIKSRDYVFTRYALDHNEVTAARAAPEDQAMPTSTAMARPSEPPLKNDAIRPFRVSFTDAELADLRTRIRATRWPEQETVKDSSQGVPLTPLRELARYWATEYDWRKCEARLNALPMFVTNIDGLDIQFIHVRSKHKAAMPLIITHGWPGSIVEQLKIIGPLTDPTAFGGRDEDAFDVVIPSMPGYGFSGKPTAPGWGPDHIANAWITLMERLGYTRYVAQGGDWGALIVELMGKQAPPGLLAIHTNMPMTLPPAVARGIGGGPDPTGLPPDEQKVYEGLKRFYMRNVAYAIEMATRPQTLYGISDSPVGLAAWLIDHGDGDDQPAKAITDAMARPSTGNWDALTRDDVLDNVTLYWLTGTGISSGRLYWENKYPFFDIKGVQIPVAVTVFPGELYQAPKSWAEKAYPKLLYYNRAEKGGHFAAWEQPQLFAEEMRASFRSLR